MTDDQKLDDLKMQLEALEAKRAELKFKHSRRGRKFIARRNIIVGAAARRAAATGELDNRVFLEVLNTYLTSAADRKLFGLPKAPENFPAWLEAGAPGCTLD